MKTRWKQTLLKLGALFLVGSFFDNVIPVELLRDQPPVPIQQIQTNRSTSSPEAIFSGYKSGGQIAPFRLGDEDKELQHNHRNQAN